MRSQLGRRKAKGEGQKSEGGGHRSQLRGTHCGAKIFMMKIFVVLLAAFVAATLSVSATQLPSGRLVEVHSVEVYTGGCTASAQATMGGRSMLRVWSFEDGAQDGVELKGLQIAALQVADKNLAFADTQPTSAVVYLPRKATDAQRAHWLMPPRR